jgi:trigger factor
VATLDYEGTVDGEPFEGGRGAGEIAELTEERFVPGFVSGILGMTPGEKRRIDARFPGDYPAQALAGKAAVFDVTLQDLKEYELPPLDDEFAKTVSTRDTLDELKAELRRRLEAVAAGRARRTIGNAIMSQLVAAHDFPLPPTMVESEVNRTVEDVATAATSAGTTFEQHLQQIGKSESELRESLRGEAESRVKAALLIEAIAKAEKITATPADIAAELEVLARRYGQPIARIRKALGNNLLSLMDGIVRTKTLDFLVDNASVTVHEETLQPPS